MAFIDARAPHPQLAIVGLYLLGAAAVLALVAGTLYAIEWLRKNVKIQ